jgi:DNA recombination protein RmuC
MTDVIAFASLALLLVLLVLGVLQIKRRVTIDMTPLLARQEELGRSIDRIDRALREELAQNRTDSQSAARQIREETTAAVNNLRETVSQQFVQLSKIQHERLDASAQKIDRLTEQTQQKLDAARTAIDTRLGSFQETLTQRLTELSEGNEKRSEAMRLVIDERLKAMQADNATKLEQMRVTVDEKLQSTLQSRLSESFKQVSERLEQVHKGLGEMQTLAHGVGDLKRVLSNVKTRGTWGEIQLHSLLEQFLSPEQYQQNVAIRPGSSERVEFAIRLPGTGQLSDDKSHVWLPIDAKFPIEDYQRLVEAHEVCDTAAIDAAAKALEQRIKGCARDIHDKYIHPPESTAFALLYLPIDGLYAEVTRNVALVEYLRREYHVEVSGPNTLPAMLCALQMGFKTLAIQKRSSEVWTVLGQVKTEFEKFGGVVEKVQKKLQEASNTIDDVGKRTRAINRKLKNVEALPVVGDDPLLLTMAREMEE